jgi:hypothetical protein
MRFVCIVDESGSGTFRTSHDFRPVSGMRQSGRPPTTLNGQIFDPRRPSKRPHPFREVHRMAARRSVNWKGLAPIWKVLSWPARASPSDSNQDRGPRVGSELFALVSLRPFRKKKTCGLRPHRSSQRPELTMSVTRGNTGSWVSGPSGPFLTHLGPPAISAFSRFRGHSRHQMRGGPGRLNSLGTRSTPADAVVADQLGPTCRSRRR